MAQPILPPPSGNELLPRISFTRFDRLERVVQTHGVPLAAAANDMMNACRGLGIDGNDFVVAHRVYRKLGGQE